ncbi:ABC transporter ATP-binding protein [Algoriphagus aquatilis]|uniref:ABC transporter ATP-binding protein n=1 Tax=Algoriphagus aquatilis TaxID=490186 RepID=A0ABW0BRG2_9BACT
MSNSVIKVQNISKRYRLGLKEKQSDTLLGQIAQAIQSPWKNLKQLRALNRFGVEDESVFWALKDISFEVKEGEVLGIIGKNGAGKSTLLKILSQITEPTSGKIEIHGRVASLLEVGTGFHPELSGRENIYMNGTILGMTRKEINSKLDEIIDFSGVEKFIDTPVKFYSSGMKVRLGFSVAAHLDPEILIIDEVLAVGDAEFQRKCLGKMDEVSKGQGRTVLFVSHNMDAVKQIAPKSLFLKNGKIEMLEDTDLVISTYLQESKLISDDYLFTFHSDKPSFENIEVSTSIGNGIQIFGMPIKIKLILNLPVVLNSLEISFQIFDQFEESAVVYNWFSSADFLNPLLNKTGKFLIEITIPSLRLYKGEYFFKFHLSDPRGKIVFESISFYSPFEVLMGDLINEWGFRSNVGLYIENCEISLSDFN